MTAAVTLCICTFRRSHIMDTLRSVSQLTLKPEWALHVIVADNDETPGAQKSVAAGARETGLSLSYIHAPACNISIARNACLGASETDLTAFIDDDELLTPGWLAAMMSEMEKSGADVVLGPVNAVYAPGCPGWIRAGDFFSTLPVWVKGKIITGYSGNVLLRKDSPAVRGIRFNENLGRSGGEDTVFFAAVHKAGGRIAFAPDAIVTENISPERMNLGWLLKRRFRAGQTHGTLLLESGGAYARKVPAAVGKALFCLAVTLATVPCPATWRFWLLRSALHFGVTARLLGKREILQYG